jgi:uncharacterized membrane protein
MLKLLWSKILIGTALSLGLLLSFIAWLRLCTQSCSDTHTYRFMGLSLEPIGMVFFALALTLFLCSLKVQRLYPIVALMVYGALGSEVMLIAIQKFQIGHWCPVCISIAACLLVAGIAIALQILFTSRGQITMNQLLTKGTAIFIATLVGFSIAYKGVAKESIEMHDTMIAKEVSFGNWQSPIGVYILTDWFCPGCHALEPVFEKVLSETDGEARITFVDFVIHPESINWIPYDLAFMMKDKDKYLQIRQALQLLAATIKEPSEDQIQAAVAPLNVRYQSLSYSQVENGKNYFDKLVKDSGAESTPSVYITNHKTHKSKLLHGSEITEENVISAIKQLSSN